MELFEELKIRGVSQSILNSVWKLFSGCPVYITKFREMSIEERNERIYNEFNGRNIRELAIKYDLSYSRTCRVINAEIDKRQNDVFSDKRH